MNYNNEQSLLFYQKIINLASDNDLIISNDITEKTNLHRLKCEYDRLKKIIENNEDRMDAEIFGLLLLLTFLF